MLIMQHFNYKGSHINPLSLAELKDIRLCHLIGEGFPVLPPVDGNRSGTQSRRKLLLVHVRFRSDRPDKVFHANTAYHLFVFLL